MLTHIHPACARFTCKTSSFIEGLGCSSSESGPVPERPSAQSPFACLGRDLRQRDIKHLVRGHYPSFNAHTDSCARPNSSFRLRFPYFDRSLQVAVSPCWKLALPDVISIIFVKALGPLPRRVPVGHIRLNALPIRIRRINLRTSASPPGVTSSARETVPAMQLQQGAHFRGCSHSLMFRLLYLLGPPVAPTAACTGQPGRLNHAMNMWLPALKRSRFYMNCDIATYPKRTN